MAARHRNGPVSAALRENPLLANGSRSPLRRCPDVLHRAGRGGSPEPVEHPPVDSPTGWRVPRTDGPRLASSPPDRQSPGTSREDKGCPGIFARWHPKSCFDKGRRFVANVIRAFQGLNSVPVIAAGKNDRAPEYTGHQDWLNESL